MGVGQKEELHIANWLRKRVKEWRNGSLTGIPYDGASDITKELLRLWKADEGRYQRLFFAQVEAAETIIFLTEAHPVYHKSMPPIPVDQPGEKPKPLVSSHSRATPAKWQPVQVKPPSWGCYRHGQS